MSEKTEELYQMVLSNIIEAFRQHNPDEDPVVQLMISDFEQAILSAMAATFPEARSRGCWFHFGQVKRRFKIDIS